MKCFVGTFHWAQTFYLWRVDWRKTSLVCQHFSSSIQFEILWCHQEDFEQLYVVKMDVLMVQYVFFLHKYFIYLCVVRVKLERFTCVVYKNYTLLKSNHDKNFFKEKKVYYWLQQLQFTFFYSIMTRFILHIKSCTYYVCWISSNKYL